MKIKNKTQYNKNTLLEYNYKGLNIYALKGIHEYVSKYILENFNKKIDILILGAGNGALDKRIYDYGFLNITSVDINKENYKFKESHFIKLDLNTNNFYKKINKKFDLIISVEIIEHLFNPYDFLNQTSKLLKKEGEAIITTPNIHSWYSRAEFLVNGTPKFFHGKPGIFDHVSPIGYGILEHYSEIGNFKVEKVFSIIKGFNYRKTKPILAFFYIGILYLILFISKIISITSSYRKINKISNGNILIFIIKSK